MDKARKKNIKRIIGLVCAVALVVLLAAMPLIARQEPEQDGPGASILSGNVATGSIHTELIGGGTLAEEEAVTITVPSAVKLTEFLVSNGDAVTQGTPVASVDRVTVMEAISQVQETLEHLSEEIEDAADVSTTEKVNALAGGTVKIIYAEKGESVQNVMLEHGALAVLSLDGLMAVDLQTQSALSAGTAVTVTLSDGTQVNGRIAKNLAGEMTVTVEDEGYAVGDWVKVTGEDGTSLGSGALYIYSPWNATAYAGTVDSIKVSVGDKLSAGKTLMILSDTGHSASYLGLVAQRQEYEQLMLDLFVLYQTETITAPCDGVVSGIDEDSVQLLRDNGQGFVLSFLANAPNGNDEIQYVNYVAKVTGVSESGWSLLVNPQPISITDYMDLSGVPMDESAMTLSCTYPEAPAGGDTPSAPEEPTVPAEPTTPEEPTDPAPEETAPLEEPAPSQGETAAEIPAQTPSESPSETPGSVQLNTAPVYELAGGAWQQIGFSSVRAGDILLFAADQSGSFVWIVRIKAANETPTVPSGSGGNFPSGSMGSFGQTQEPSFELYSLDVSQIASVTPQDTMTLEITVDELDIGALQPGMTATVKINALGGEKYTAAITEIGNTGTNSGGSSKFTVELTMPRSGNMLGGMNATATVILSTVNDVPTIPADALVEQGNQTIVYTGYDEETETLLNPVAVKTGVSDGETVEILEGLSLGQTYYYAYYDTLEVSLTPDFGGSGFPFG